MTRLTLLPAFLLIALLLNLNACRHEEPTLNLNTLLVNPGTVSFGKDGGTSSFTIQTNAASWSINASDTSWLHISTTSGTGNISTVTLTVTTRTLSARSATLEITAGTAKSVKLTVSQSASTYLYTLTSDYYNLSFDNNGGITFFTITTDLPEWNITSTTDWLQFSQKSGTGGSTVITVTASGNNLTDSRSAVFTISGANNTPLIKIAVSQGKNLYPNYNTSRKDPDATGMSSTAVQLAAKMQMGINFGNTMESPNEGDWQTSKLTESYVKFVKQTGFNAVRLPTGWVHSHLSDPAKAKIDTAWLSRVKEVVGWCVANDMYVILNVHGDWGWLEDNVNDAKKDSVNAMQKAIWEQIATTMRDFDEHLIFASTNEPKVDNAEQMSILLSYHQTFVNAVRATGGRNSYRVLVVQGPHTDIDITYNLMNTLPTDPVPNHLMVEIHDYTPSVFTILLDGDASWGKMVYYWGTGNHSTIEPDRNATSGEEDVIVSGFQKMKQKFVDKGIPVIMGEYAALRRTADYTKYIPKDLDMHNKSVNYWTYYLTKQAKAYGIQPFYWEQGPVLDRKNNVVLDQGIVDALIEGSK